MGASRTFNSHHPRKRMIQYAAALMLNHRLSGILDRPFEPGDDRCGMDRVS